MHLTPRGVPLGSRRVGFGVCAAGADSMRSSFERGEPVETANVHTIADGIAVRVPIPESIADMRGLVDEVQMVTDEQIIEAKLDRDRLVEYRRRFPFLNDIGQEGEFAE